MSKISITPNASGTGVFTISSPATNTNRSLTLPDEAGTIITTAGVPSSAMPAGSVLQVVQATPAPTAVAAAVTGSNYPNLTTANTTLGFSASITPISTSSKILIQFVSSVDANTSNTEEWVALFRGTTLLQTSNWYRRVTGDEPQKHALIYLDSPSSVSSVQYDFRCASSVANTMFFNRDNANNSSTAWACNTNIILTEIAG
jgi:hypothetical protein